MKYFILFIILLISIINVNAEISIFKNKYYVGETFQAELKFQSLFNLVEISNIKILNQNNETSNIGVILNQINKETYFVCFDIPNIESGKYKLQVKDIKFIENNILKKENFEKEFEISKKDENILSVNPPLIIYEEINFYKVDFMNKGSNILELNISDKTNSLKINPYNLTLTKDSKDSIYISIINLTKNKLNLSISYSNNTFDLPIYIKNEIKQPQKQNIIFFVEKNGNKFYLSEFKFNISFGTYTEANIFLENNFYNMSNLKVSIDGNIKDIIKLGYTEIPVLESKKSIQLNFYIDKIANIGYYSGNIIVKNKEVESKLQLSINVLKETTKEEIKTIENNTKIETQEKVNSTNQVKQKETKINKKLLSYILISVVIIIFLIIYLIFIKKANKNKPKEYNNLF